MPADIRSFFGGKPAAQPAKPKEDEPTKKRGRPARKVVADSDDEDEPPKKATPKKDAPKKQAKREPSPEGEATTASDFFGNKKPARSAPNKTAKPPAKVQTPKSSPVKAKANGKSNATPTRTSARKTKPATYAEVKDEDDDFLDDDEDGDDIFTAAFKKGKQADDYQESSDDEPVALPQRQGSAKDQKKLKKDEDFEPEEDVDMKDVDPEDESVVPDDDEEIIGNKSTKKSKPAAKAGRKRKSAETDDELDTEPPKKARGRLASTKASPAKKKAKKDEPESATMKKILDDIPLVRPPSPPPKNGEGKKFDFKAHHANSGPAPQSGSVEIPEGEPNCLAGLTFVFTGLLQYLDREAGQQLVKRYGGKVTTSPSSKTSYVVLGSDAGPSKLQKIKQFNLRTINEEGLFALIKKLPANGGDSKAAEAFEKKQAAEAKKIKEMAEEMEKEERRAGGAGGAGGGKAAPASASSSQAQGSASQSTNADSGPDSRLWTVKYAPTQLAQICGNKGQVEKLQRWLRNFPKSQRKGFKLGGVDGSGLFRAVMIHGPPGIGKTTAAHLVAKLEGYDIVESNASDTRSKKLVQEGLQGVLETTSLLGYFAGDGKKVEESRKKLVLIMDEVDGMSAGDRGGVGALAAVCKKSQIPMILICNDRRLPKMKPFDYVTYDLPFRRPTTDQIRSRIMTIAYREGLKMPKNVVDALIEGTNADIRQVVNMVSTAKLDEEAMDFDRSKSMSKAWEKHIILKPWDIVGKILQGHMFSETSKHSLNDKTELYFNDHELSYLMLQENYLGTNPIRAANYQGKDRNLKLLELVDNAAESISDGDLVDRMIHGSQQQWSLMPTHAIFSFVRPASFVAGSMAGFKTNFPQWLGKNSTQGKLTRMVKEIQGHMRLRTSGDRHEIRQQYIPILWQELVKKLEQEGKEAVPEVIELMDSYFLTKEDFDAILELGVGPMDMEKVKIESQSKATFTRLYNQQSHPVPFMKASAVVAPTKAAKEKPDLEEAIEESDEGEVVEDPDAKKEEDDEGDITKDKYIKQPKKKAAPKKKARSKAANDDEEEEEKPKKGKGKGRAKK
ncbi:replication factor RFC1 C terminal domain-containing protein [Macrophomina phaseolina]|uniref:Replication factor C subunit 1 n=1 Tax=Macrophomina phaseolina TaxID=35725 RepID=A0ABQ8GNE4_9PEZI|nr:replication factor RFC1 C terminal domain-containing protein [Macrophomina phaseolina]